VTYPKHVAFDLEHRTTDPPLLVEAAVSYSDAKPSYFLAVGVFDLESGNPVAGSGSSTGTCDPTYAACFIGAKSTSAVEHVGFLLAGYRPTMSMAIIAVLLDETKNLIYTSESDYVFTVTMTATLALRVRLPGSVRVTVDGMTQGEGTVWLNLVPGDHTVSVPEIVQLDNVTRLKFQDWSDGVGQNSRSVSLTHQTLLTAEYVTQYWLNATTSHGKSQGSGWYDDESTAVYSIQSTTVPMENVLCLLGGKWVFQGWYEQGELVTQSRNGTVIMLGAHSIAAHWVPDLAMPAILFGGIAVILCLIVLVRRGNLVLEAQRTPQRRRRKSKARRIRKT
jgi:hypothetical protein